jgi:hypothetical protein
MSDDIAGAFAAAKRTSYTREELKEMWQEAREEIDASNEEIRNALEQT